MICLQLFITGCNIVLSCHLFHFILVTNYQLNCAVIMMRHLPCNLMELRIIWVPSSEFVSSSISSWQILTAHVQPFRGATYLAFCLKVPLDSLLVWASSEGSGETARMRRLDWTFASRIGDKYQICLTRLIYPVAFNSSEPRPRNIIHKNLLSAILEAFHTRFVHTCTDSEDCG